MLVDEMDLLVTRKQTVRWGTSQSCTMLHGASAACQQQSGGWHLVVVGSRSQGKEAHLLSWVMAVKNKNCSCGVRQEHNS